ncbi:MAG: preprotein translocase subunit SecE [Parcubacteria group bacterium SW_6_46_9]|nr:MAG: preprotein translocase subunit SecE [Parcubacteria group bacterium SW_6_46_9]
MDSITTYLKGVWAELQKVKWPTQREAGALTALVILFSLAIAGYLGLLDQIFTRLIEPFIL